MVEWIDRLLFELVVSWPGCNASNLFATTGSNVYLYVRVVWQGPSHNLFYSFISSSRFFLARPSFIITHYYAQTEKESYLKWSKNNADVERLQRFVVASEYQHALQVLNGSSGDVSDLETQVEQLDLKVVDYQKLIESKEEEIELKTTQLRDEYEGSMLKDAKSKEEKHSKELVRVTSLSKNCQDDINKATTDLNAAKTAVDETQLAVTTKQVRCATV